MVDPESYDIYMKRMKDLRDKKNKFIEDQNSKPGTGNIWKKKNNVKPKMVLNKPKVEGMKRSQSCKELTNEKKNEGFFDNKDNYDGAVKYLHNELYDGTEKET